MRWNYRTVQRREKGEDRKAGGAKKNFTSSTSEQYSDDCQRLSLNFWNWSEMSHAPLSGWAGHKNSTQMPKPTSYWKITRCRPNTSQWASLYHYGRWFLVPGSRKNFKHFFSVPTLRLIGGAVMPTTVRRRRYSIQADKKTESTPGGKK